MREIVDIWEGNSCRHRIPFYKIFSPALEYYTSTSTYTNIHLIYYLAVILNIFSVIFRTLQLFFLSVFYHCEGTVMFSSFNPNDVLEQLFPTRGGNSTRDNQSPLKNRLLKGVQNFAQIDWGEVDPPYEPHHQTLIDTLFSVGWELLWHISIFNFFLIPSKNPQILWLSVFTETV